MRVKFLFKIILIIFIGINLSFTGCRFWEDDDISADAKSVAKDMADLVIVYASGDNVASVTQNITLATEGGKSNGN